MILLDKLNDAPKQSYILISEDRQQIPIYLYYAPSQETWFFDLSYRDFVIRGIQLVVSPNVLRNYKNIIPFGLSVTSADGSDPYYLNDFITGRIAVYLLSAAEVEQIEANFYT